MPVAEKLAQRENDIVVVWRFGPGTAASGVDAIAAKLQKMLGCPVIKPHRLAALTAFQILPIGFDDKAMAGHLGCFWRKAGEGALR